MLVNQWQKRWAGLKMGLTESYERQEQCPRGSGSTQIILRRKQRRLLNQTAVVGDYFCSSTNINLEDSFPLIPEHMTSRPVDRLSL